LVQDAQKHGVRVEDVCILRSTWDSTLEEPSDEEIETAERARLLVSASGASEGRLLPHENQHRVASAASGAKKKVRLGFRLIQGLSRESAERIEALRTESKVESLEIFLKQAKLRKNEMESLAKAGAFEAIEPGRRQALWKTRTAVTRGLFAEVGSTEAEVILPALRSVDQLVLDYEHKGLSLEDHPLRYYRKRLQKLGAVRAQDLRFLAKKSWVKVAGLVTNRQRPATASGVVFMTLEDETGVANLILKAEMFDSHQYVARHSELLFVEGVLERDAQTEPGNETQTPVIHVLVHKLTPLRAQIPARVSPGESRRGSRLASLSRNFR
jgi:error-prone DNA polymerase